MKGKILIILLIFAMFYIKCFAQTYPRNQNIVAGEYYIDTDPGEGNGIPINGLYNFANVNVAFNLNIPEGSVVYVRFKSSNGTWSAPFPIQYKKPFPNRGATLVTAEYFINNDPGIGKGIPLQVDYYGKVTFQLDSLKENDVVYIRFKDSYERWSPARMIQYHAISANRGANIVAAEYFIDHDPGVGNAIPVSVDVFGNVLIENLKIKRNGKFYIRYKDSFGRWSPARYMPYTFQDIVKAEYILKYFDGTLSDKKVMTIQPHTDPDLAFFKALSNESINNTANIDTLIIRFSTEDIIGQWQKFKWSEIPVTGIAKGKALPTKFKLYANYPNPFNPNTTIEYDLPENTNVKLEIFNMLGQKIKTLISKEQARGKYRIQWEGTNDQGVRVPSGIYFYKLSAGRFIRTKRMIMLK